MEARRAANRVWPVYDAHPPSHPHLTASNFMSLTAVSSTYLTVFDACTDVGCTMTTSPRGQDDHQRGRAICS